MAPVTASVQVLPQLQDLRYKSQCRVRRRDLSCGRGIRSFHSCAPVFEERYNGSSEFGGESTKGADLPKDEQVFLQVLRDSLAEEGLSDAERQRIEAAIEATLDGRGAEAFAAIEEEALARARHTPAPRPDVMDADEAAEFLSVLDATAPPTANPPSTVAKARELFDNLAVQAEKPLDYYQCVTLAPYGVVQFWLCIRQWRSHDLSAPSAAAVLTLLSVRFRLRERNERRLLREQTLIEDDAEAVAAWAEEHIEQV